MYEQRKRAPLPKKKDPIFPIRDYYTNRAREMAIDNFNLKTREEQDAFRHAWTSADAAYRTTGGISQFFGDANEVLNTNNNPHSRNMDDWNNHAGRNVGEDAKKRGIPREQLPNMIYEKLKKGDLIIDEHNDKRRYDRSTFGTGRDNPFTPPEEYNDNSKGTVTGGAAPIGTGFDKIPSIEEIDSWSTKKFRENEKQVDEWQKNGQLKYEDESKWNRLGNGFKKLKSWF